ncbi:MAG: hypothetical protein OEU26_14805 [Candidatus Tectomicrobia bacterium]|nr:hypothetical protein [Candidatus Tectomicrobia bacterium]
MAISPRNLTDNAWVQNAHDDDLGTAIYWIRDDDGNLEQFFVPTVTRERSESLTREFTGRWNLEAYKWVPELVESSTSLVGSLCGGRCNTDADCVNNACICENGHCTKK